MFDLVLSGATVIDGTAAPPRRVDVGIRDGRIAAVDHLDEVLAAERVELAGRVLAPGFIDIHTHSDLTLLEDGAGESKVLQGVTTEVVGNCSFSAFPIEPSRLALHADHLARATAALTPWWHDLDGYAAAIEEAGVAINVVPLVGHGTLRVAAMGVEQRAPTADERARMVRQLEASLEQGAFGMSTGLTHVPSAYGEFDEVAELAEVVAGAGALYATHCRALPPDERAAVAEAIETGRRCGVAVEFSHLAINRPERWGTGAELLAMFDAARDDGVEISYDVYPYDASSSSLTQYLPPWVQAGGTAALRARLAEPRQRARALRDMEDGWFGGIPWLWDRFVVSSAPDGYGTNATLAGLAAAEGLDPAELTLQLCERYGNELQVVLFYRSEADVAEFVAHPLAVIGSDGNAIALRRTTDCPHPRNFGTFPRVLGRYARERSVVTLADAVRKMTGEPARRLGLAGRGTVAVGAVADLVVFDPDTVVDRADFGAAPLAPLGIERVLVAGEHVVRDGAVTAARPGRVLRHR